MKTSLVHSRRRAQHLLSTAALAGALVLSACSGDDTDGDPDDPSAGLSEVEAHAGEECPTELAAPEGGSVDEPATDTPSLPAPESAFVCLYDLTGEPPAWRLSGAPVAATDRQLRTLTGQLAELAPADADRACPGKRGPRWLLVSTVGDDLTGVVVDDYGCADVRLTDEPFENAPGEATQDGTVPGVLGGTDELLNQLKLIWVAG